MGIEFENSKTKENLMRAFAGESQARNRYTFAADVSKKANMHVIEAVFKFTADQEKEHAEIFFNHLAQFAGESIEIDNAGYPIDISDSVLQLLRFAQHNEYEEHDSVYSAFEATAKSEGFDKISADFRNIASIEKTHGDRFGKFADLLEEGKLFVADAEIDWMCLNCGFIYKGKEAPVQCPVCGVDRGYYVRLELAPYTCGKMLKNEQ